MTLKYEDIMFGYSLAIFDSDTCDKSQLYELQQRHIDDNSLDKIVFVALEGSTDPKLDSSRFLVENREASWTNHMMWNAHLTEEEQNNYTYDSVREFIKTGKQMYIENYEFVEDEPFYDYSGR